MDDRNSKVSSNDCNCGRFEDGRAAGPILDERGTSQMQCYHRCFGTFDIAGDGWTNKNQRHPEKTSEGQYRKMFCSMCIVVEGNKRRGPEMVNQVRMQILIHSNVPHWKAWPGISFLFEFNCAYELLFPAVTANRSTTCFDEAEGFEWAKRGKAGFRAGRLSFPTPIIILSSNILWCSFLCNFRTMILLYDIVRPPSWSI